MAKTLFWLGSSLSDLRQLPEDARRDAGYQLRRVQEGLDPIDWKPMPIVGAGVQEIRLHGDTEQRVFYVARFTEAVYVLHVFEKKTQKAPKGEVGLGQKRYRDLMEARRKDRHGKN